MVSIVQFYLKKNSALCKMFEFLFGMAIDYGAMKVMGC
jgi:hypothetical protein